MRLKHRAPQEKQAPLQMRGRSFPLLCGTAGFPEAESHHRYSLSFSLRTDTVLHKADLYVRKELRQTHRYGLQGKLRLGFTLRAAEVRTENHARPVFKQVVYRGQRRCDSLVIRYLARIVKRHIVVHANQYALAFHVNIHNGLFRHFDLSSQKTIICLFLPILF